MAKFPSVVNSSNFTQALSFVDSLEISFKRKNLIKKIVRPISSLLFCFLSFLVIYGAFLSFSSPEDMAVFIKLGFITDMWDFYSGIFAVSELAPYIAWPILVVATYVIPLVFSAIITILVTLFVRNGNQQPAGDTEATKAKDLYLRAEKLYSKSSNYEDGDDRRIFKIIFVVCLAAFLIYGLIILKLMNVGVIIGMVVSMVLVYFIFGLLFLLFYTINRQFYKKPFILYCKNRLDEYWLSVDPEEKKRREEEAEEKRKQKEAKAASKVTSNVTSNAASGGNIDKYNTFTWTFDYVENNQGMCSDVCLSILHTTKEVLRERKYRDAANGFQMIVKGLEFLIAFDEETYLSPLYANCYALSRVFAFGLYDKEAACTFAEKACVYAHMRGTSMANRDLVVMMDFWNELKSSKPLSVITEEFGYEFPYDILESN